MADRLTIAERIDRRVLAILAQVAGVVAVHRADFRGDDLIPGHAYLFDEGENASEGGMGDPGGGTTSVVYELIVGVCIVASAQEPDTPAAIVKRWHGRLHGALMADPDLTDEFNEALCNDLGGVEYLAADSLQLESDQTEVFVARRYRFAYQMYRDDAYAGPGITAQVG